MRYSHVFIAVLWCSSGFGQALESVRPFADLNEAHPLVLSLQNALTTASPQDGDARPFPYPATRVLTTERNDAGPLAFAPQRPVATTAPQNGNARAFGYAGPGALTTYGPQSEDRLYESGQRALDTRRWEEALQVFTQAASKNASRADGATFWKAYALRKLGRRDEALAAIADLRKSFPNSRCLDEAKALEFELRQASGQNVSPEAESDEEIKLLALNGLMRSDPDRAFPILENLLKSAQSPRLKKNAVFVLAQNDSPRAAQLLEQVARGQGNPDLQLAAIRYLGEKRRDGSRAPLLAEIYNASSDTTVKRAVLQALGSSRDKDRLLQIAKTEKSPDLRLEAIRYLSSNKDTATSDALVSLYGPETDPRVKRAIVDSLSAQGNAKALVQLARSEKDLSLKQNLVQRLSTMKSPDATEYLMEILK